MINDIWTVCEEIFDKPVGTILTEDEKLYLMRVIGVNDHFQEIADGIRMWVRELLS